MKKRTISFSVLAVFAILALTACGGIASSANVSSNTAPLYTAPTQAAAAPAPVPAGASSDLLAAYQGTLENLYASVSPSVVNIRVVQKVDASNSGTTQIPGFPFFNLPQGHPQTQPQQQYQSALGSGFVWDTNGDIVTNNHVISGAEKIEVAFSDGTIVPAKLVGADPDSDLAVIKVDVPADKLHPVQMGDSNAVKVGQLAIAIGNPFGLEGTMTTGIISAMGRSLPADENAANSYTIPDIIQTDAPINPGNSGGILMDAQGQVLGVTSAIESPVRASAGVGFAIPSDIVKNVIPALIKDGKFVHSWVGISGVTLVPDLATAMKLDSSQRGALVEEILPNSPAEQAGLKGSSQQVAIEGQNTNVGGDVITAIDNQPVVEMSDIIAYLARSTQVGQKVTLTIIRDGKQQTVDITLAARPSAQERASATAQSNNATSGVHLGILGTTVDQSVAKEMNLPDGQQGVLVEQVESGSLAETAGLRAGTKSATINGQQVNVGGDIITAVNGQAVTSIEDLKAMLAQLTSGQELSLTILRDGKEVQVTVQAGQ